jgi:hypothetical protein
MKKLVTKESLISLMETNAQMKIQVIGRALVGLMKRQEAEEINSKETKFHNCRGFAPSDARSGTLTALYFLKNKTLLDWQIERWTRPSVTGLPRIVKYSRQLNEIANEKQTSK